MVVLDQSRHVFQRVQFARNP